MILSLTAFFANPTYGLDEEDVRVAVIDTGISSAAISAENLAEGQNYILPNNSTEDDIGHGTAVAGIIVGSETAGVEGLCPAAELVPLVYYSKAGELWICIGRWRNYKQSVEYSYPSAMWRRMPITEMR